MTHRLRATVPSPPLKTLCVFALCLLLAACASRGETASPEHDTAMPPLDALMGEWYVVAHVPWFGERGRVASRYRLAAHEGEAISVTRTWRDGFAEPLESDTSIARREGSSGRTWKLRAFRVLPTRLRLLEAASDGSWMLLDSPGRDHAWILTRAQRVEDEAYLELERRMRGNGVNTDKLRRVPQLPEQEGRLGFEPAAVPTRRR
jgi:apolipoprotein D and lipocalin family protein